MATFRLTAGDDFLAATPSDDRILAFEGHDLIEAGDGYDLIYGGAGNDTLRGQAGSDIFYVQGQPGRDEIDGGDDVDFVLLDFSRALNRLSGTFTGIRVDARDALTGASWDVLVRGDVRATITNVENLVINSGRGDDFILAGGGADDLDVGGGNDRVFAGAGHDIVRKTWGQYTLDGGQGVDRLFIRAVDDIEAGAALTFDAVAGTIAAGTTTSGTFRRFENYQIEATAQGDVITVGSASDLVQGYGGNDLIHGGAGNDTLDGGPGVDTLCGGNGHDWLRAGTPSPGIEADEYYGGDGNDRISLAPSFVGGTTSLAGLVIDGGAGNDTLELPYQLIDLDISGALISDVEVVTMSAGSDRTLYMTTAQAMQVDDLRLFAVTLAFTDAGAVVLDGENTVVHRVRLADGGQTLDLSDLRPMPGIVRTVTGGAGDDDIRGSVSREAMFGGNGDDTLHGNHGKDSLTGADGADTFVFATLADTAATVGGGDVILDFSRIQGDRIDLSAIDANGTAAGNAAGSPDFVFIGTAAFSGVGQVQAVQSGADTILRLNTDDGNAPEAVIRLVNTLASAVVATDFVL